MTKRLRKETFHYPVEVVKIGDYGQKLFNVTQFIGAIKVISYQNNLMILLHSARFALVTQCFKSKN